MWSARNSPGTSLSHAVVGIRLCSAAAVAACAATVGSPGSAATTPASFEARIRSNAGRLTAAQLTAAGASNTRDAIARLHPEFLRASPRAVGSAVNATPSVYLDGVLAGDLSTLNTIPLNQVREIAFLHPAEALVRFGERCPCGAGVLLVITRA